MGSPSAFATNVTVTANLASAPAITSASSTTFALGAQDTFTVKTTGSPTPSLSETGDALPSGVTFHDNGNGTATLSGIPAANTVKSYNLTITASNSAGPATQPFTLTVSGGSGGTLPPGTITTVAGMTAILQSNVPATSAVLGNVEGVATDAFGNVFAADPSNNAVMKITPSGTLTIVAGTGVAGGNGGGFSGDGGPATSALLAFPVAVAVDAAGNLYIADESNNRIRKVDTSGIITTVAGNGISSFSGDNGPATSAAMRFPLGVAVDTAGNLYIADAFNNRIRKVDTTGTISTFAGTGAHAFAGDGGPATSAALSAPSGVAVDSSGNLFIADTGNSRIRKVNTGGTISTVAGINTLGFSGDGGPATSAQLDLPWAVAIDAAGNFYISDFASHRVRSRLK